MMSAPISVSKAEGRRIEGGKIRYAVVGGGWISQAAFMPGVAHTGNSELVALVTGDPEKARELGRRYGLKQTCGYDGFDDLLKSGEIDAVYLALPNDQHRDFALRTLDAGIHLLLEKPMATRVEDCEAMEAAARRSGAKLMIAYRLHFEPGSLAAIETVRSGRLGHVFLFSSVFSQHVARSNHRADHGYWAGPVTDMGPYPINAARNLFGAEPIEVSATGVRNPELGFDFDDTVSVTMRFPGERLAQFVVSYAGDPAGQYHVVGTKGVLEVSGYGFGPGVSINHKLLIGGKSETRSFPETDQFGGETRYFSDCILNGRDPEPGGEEGRADVRILVAIEAALRTGQPQKLEPFTRARRPDPAQKTELANVEPPPLVNAAAPDEG